MEFECPLSGLKVIDLTSYISGPFCTKLLAGLGAEVIKVEKPGQGDPARALGPFKGDAPGIERSGLFLYLNTCKKSITLNLKSKTGINILWQLIRDADVLVENFPPGVLEQLGLDYESLELQNRELILTRISNFGQTGPYRNYKAADIVEQALGGLMYICGDSDREPLKQSDSQAQYQAGLSAALATLIALYYRDETGVGQEIDVSIMETVISVLDFTTVMYSYQRGIRRRIGSRHPFAGHPTGILPCKDGYIAFAVQLPRQWESLCAMIGKPELLEDPRFSTALDRCKHASEIDNILSPWLMERNADDIFHLCQLWRIPTGLVCTAKDLFDDPQYRERNFFIEIGHPQTGILRYPGAPFKLGEGNWRFDRAPLLGEHNDEIYLGWLQYSQEEIDDMHRQGVI